MTEATGNDQQTLPKAYVTNWKWHFLHKKRKRRCFGNERQSVTLSYAEGLKKCLNR